MKHPGPCKYDDSLFGSTPETDYCSCVKRTPQNVMKLKERIDECFRARKEHECLIQKLNQQIEQLQVQLPIECVNEGGHISDNGFCYSFCRICGELLG